MMQVLCRWRRTSAVNLFDLNLVTNRKIHLTSLWDKKLHYRQYRDKEDQAKKTAESATSCSHPTFWLIVANTSLKIKNKLFVFIEV